MTQLVYYIICIVLSVSILIGIHLMSKVDTCVLGNLINCLAAAAAIAVTLIYSDIISQAVVLYISLACLLAGTVIGLYMAYKVKMIQMPQMVGLLNGIGGAASAIVGGCTMFTASTVFEFSTAVIALIIGTITFAGSLVAAAKLSNIISSQPINWRGHHILTTASLVIIIVISICTIIPGIPVVSTMLISIIVSAFLGTAITIRVGGADMPITISLLNSLSGVAGAIAGMAIGDIFLVSAGGIVGASGLLLTQIMCSSMNSSLLNILQGKTSIGVNNEKKTADINVVEQDFDAINILRKAKKVIIVPGYGMALAQAQYLVKELSDILEKNGTQVKYAIHPVAGRMPGHMNVLLCEAGVEYEQLFEMDDINEEFASCDVCIVVGANDVLNPASREAEGTPIYGMPILNVDQAKHIIFCNYDLKPGYAGVDNPLYFRKSGVSFLLGDASKTLQKLLDELRK